MKKESTLSIMDRMVKDNNPNILLSTTITDVNDSPQGAIVSFGVEKKIGDSANSQKITGHSEYMVMCFAVKRSELQKYRELTINEAAK